MHHYHLSRRSVKKYAHPGVKHPRVFSCGYSEKTDSQHWRLSQIEDGTGDLFAKAITSPRPCDFLSRQVHLSPAGVHYRLFRQHVHVTPYFLGHLFCTHTPKNRVICAPPALLGAPKDWEAHRLSAQGFESQPVNPDCRFGMAPTRSRAWLVAGVF